VKYLCCKHLFAWGPLYTRYFFGDLLEFEIVCFSRFVFGILVIVVVVVVVVVVVLGRLYLPW